MIKAILCDADGVIITSPQMFSQTLAQEHGLSTDKTLDFFHGSFPKMSDWRSRFEKSDIISLEGLGFRL